jgi:hypothetical protein
MSSTTAPVALTAPNTTRARAGLGQICLRIDRVGLISSSLLLHECEKSTVQRASLDCRAVLVQFELVRVPYSRTVDLCTGVCLSVIRISLPDLSFSRGTVDLHCDPSAPECSMFSLRARTGGADRRPCDAQPRRSQILSAGASTLPSSISRSSGPLHLAGGTRCGKTPTSPSRYAHRQPRCLLLLPCTASTRPAPHPAPSRCT